MLHCKAGVGRTGTLLALINSMLIADQSPKLSIFSVVRRLREQRYSMVETQKQYKFIYTLLTRYAKEKKVEMQNHFEWKANLPEKYPELKRPDDDLAEDF